MTGDGAAAWVFRILFGATLAETGVAYFFFLTGLARGTVSTFNMIQWILVLLLVTVVPVLGWTLGSHGKTWPAIGVLSVLAIPGFLYAAYILLLLTSGVTWR